MQPITTSSYTFPTLIEGGYLYVDKTDRLLPLVKEETGQYFLSRPRRFGKSLSFNRWLIRAFSYTENEEHIILNDIVRFLRDGADVKMLLDRLSCFFSKIPYDLAIDREKYYQALFVAVFTLLNARVGAEVKTNDGRIDAVIETPKFIYVFEFKLNGTADAAMKQINEKKYYERYLDSGKRVTLVGVAFDHEKRNIGEHKVEVIG